MSPIARDEFLVILTKHSSDHTRETIGQLLPVLARAADFCHTFHKVGWPNRTVTAGEDRQLLISISSIFGTY